jgi:hypothetical protein
MALPCAVPSAITPSSRSMRPSVTPSPLKSPVPIRCHCRPDVAELLVSLLESANSGVAGVPPTKPPPGPFGLARVTELVTNTDVALLWAVTKFATAVFAAAEPSLRPE